MADGVTDNLALVLPEDGLSTDTWGLKLNADLVALDDEFDPVTGHDHSQIGAPVPPLGLAGIAFTGIVVAADATDFVTRAVAAGVGVSVVNGTGVSGDPTVSLDINGLTVKTEAVSADLVVVHDASSGALRKITRANFLAGVVGSVAGPGASTDEALARFNGATGQIIQNSVALLTDAGVLSGVIFGPHRIQSQALGSVSGSVVLNLANGTHISLTVGGGTTFSVSNPPATGHLGTLMIEVTGGGNFGLVWPSSFKWPGGVAPILSSGVDIIFAMTRDGGSTWRATRTMRNSS